MEQEFETIFHSIRPFFIKHADACLVLSDDISYDYLGTNEIRDRDGYRTGFGRMEIKKNYVSVHLMPIYVYPEMLENISVQLRKRMQGKPCFNFKKVDQEFFEELNGLINAGFSRFQEDGRL